MSFLVTALVKKIFFYTANSRFLKLNAQFSEAINM